MKLPKHHIGAAEAARTVRAIAVVEMLEHEGRLEELDACLLQVASMGSASTVEGEPAPSRSSEHDAGPTTSMTRGQRRHLIAASWTLCMLAACGGQILGGGGGAGDLALGGGMMKTCAAGPAPQTAAEEVLDDYPDGQRCVVLSCAELDPDQTGDPGGINARPPDTDTRQVHDWRASYTLGMFGNGCESSKPATCEPRRHGSHRGGNRRHNVCSDVYGPRINDYYTVPLRGGVLWGDGSDAMLNGVCLDGKYLETNSAGEMTRTRGWEYKTARYGTSRLSGRPVCLFLKQKILANLFASILKEYPAVRLCGDKYEYHLMFADEDLWNALNELRNRTAALLNDPLKPDPATAAIHLMSWNRPVTDADIKAGRAVSITSLLVDDLRIPKANLDVAKAIVVEYLAGPPPTSARPPERSKACDDWKLGDTW